MILNSTIFASYEVLEHFLRFFQHLEKIELEEYTDNTNVIFANILLSNEGDPHSTMNLLSLCWANEKIVAKKANELADLWCKSDRIFPKAPRDDFEQVKKACQQSVQEIKIKKILN
jgi:hypothetical protein